MIQIRMEVPLFIKIFRIALGVFMETEVLIIREIVKDKYVSRKKKY
jgi:hypothetical protein